MNRTIPVDQLAELLRVGAVNRRLRAENERLRGKALQLHGYQAAVERLETQRDALRAEVENLKQAIEQTWRPEVKALRAANVGLIADAVDIAHQRDQAWEDIEQLRAALGLGQRADQG